ncbi:MAG: M13 family peptidase [Alphaproteobacteria bacterium]|uniref:Peptidase M13 C-terminal domain-containing protein n=1 Tax=viral metagenome TaxID=1070528 RepID=A0A6C0HPS3_9ZZZZ|nr:M13 family peptidase [Alphaproteobacteria bacterium]
MATKGKKINYKKNTTKKRRKSYSLVKTKKTKANVEIGLKSFEEEFEKTLSKDLVKSNEKIKNEFVRKLLSNFSPAHLKPNQDFYDYINYKWLQKDYLSEEQKYIVQVDDFRLTQDKVYRQLNDLILKYIKTHNDPLAKNLKNFYYSVIKMNDKQHSRRIAKETVKKIDELRKNKGNVWKMLAYANKDEVVKPRAPFVWSVNPDNKHSTINRCYLDSHVFSMVDFNIYFDDGTDIEYKRKFRSNFRTFCKKLFDTVLGPNDLNPGDVFDVEMEMMNALICTDATTSTETYNKIGAEEAEEKYGFNWKEFTKDLGYKHTPEFFITSNPNYLKCGTKLLVDNWDSKKWRTYWIYIFLIKIARMTSDWETVNFDFFGSFERGQEAINKSDAVSASLYMSVPFNTFLTNEYVANYETPQNVKYVETMCNDLKIVFTRIMKRNSWLSPSTKKYALNKLKHMKFVIAKPEQLREDPLLDYGLSLIENMDKIHAWRHAQYVELDGKPVVDIPIMDWTQYPVKMVGTQAYVVNASYTPSKNSIYINLGYIQKPFVDLDERGIEYNLAHLGFTIGHEMGHGFDDWGSQYDEQGNLHSWWTDHDKKAFKKIQEDVIKQYEEFAARDKIKFDASIGVGEDLADIAGLAICDEYLRDYQNNNEDIVPIQTLSFEAFYTYFAIQQRQQVGKKALAAQLKTNPHPLDKYRCNIPLSRSQIFRALYNVKEGDGMWWHNTETVW